MILFMETQMCACCDVNWAGNMDDHKFTSTYVFFLGNGDINYNIKKYNSIVKLLTMHNIW